MMLPVNPTEYSLLIRHPVIALYGANIDREPWKSVEMIRHYLYNSHLAARNV
jgi:hypothetical protein